MDNHEKLLLYKYSIERMKEKIAESTHICVEKNGFILSYIKVTNNDFLKGLFTKALQSIEDEIDERLKGD